MYGTFHVITGKPRLYAMINISGKCNILCRVHTFKKVPATCLFFSGNIQEKEEEKEQVTPKAQQTDSIRLLLKKRWVNTFFVVEKFLVLQNYVCQMYVVSTSHIPT